MRIDFINIKSLVSSDIRLDSKFHLNDGNKTLRQISRSPFAIKTVRDFTQEIFYGGRSRRYYVENQDNGVPFMGSSDMLKNDFSGLKYISKKYTQNLEKLVLDNEWILISRSGTVGNVVYTNELFKGKTASEHIIRLIPNKKILSGFLYSYFASKHGYNLLNMGQFGAVIQHITPEFIVNLPVPIFPKEKQIQIHQLIVEASELRVEANKLLNESVKLFENELCSNEVSMGYQVGFISSRSLDDFHKRLDGQYQLIWKNLKQLKTPTVCRFAKAGIFSTKLH